MFVREAAARPNAGDAAAGTGARAFWHQTVRSKYRPRCRPPASCRLG